MGMYVITITLRGQVFGKIEEHESEHETILLADLRLHGQKPSCRQREDIDYRFHSSWFSP